MNLEKLDEIVAHNEGIYKLINLHNNIMASNSLDNGQIKFWNMQTKECINTLKVNGTMFKGFIKIGKS